MKIIAFTGMPFSGKSVAVEVAKERGLPVVRMGDMVWGEVKRRGLPLTDETVGRIATAMRKTYGKDIWAQQTLKKIQAMDRTKTLIIDGIRNHEEIEAFKQALGEEFVVIAITAPDAIRYQRALTRGREDDSSTLEQIKERDEREKGWGIEAVIASADIVVPNEGSKEEFITRIRQILKK